MAAPWTPEEKGALIAAHELAIKIRGYAFTSPDYWKFLADEVGRPKEEVIEYWSTDILFKAYRPGVSLTRIDTLNALAEYCNIHDYDIDSGTSTTSTSSTPSGSASSSATSTSAVSSSAAPTVASPGDVSSSAASTSSTSAASRSARP